MVSPGAVAPRLPYSDATGRSVLFY